MENLKVIFHLNDEERLTTAYNNIMNTIKENDKIQIELLINGSAASLVVSNEQIIKLVEIINVTVCNNSLNSLDIGLHQIISKVNVVPSGVVELIIKQADSFAYIKP